MDEFIWQPMKKLRQELLANCGELIKIFVCCCEKTLTFQGVVIEVGTNFVELKVECTGNAQGPAVIVVPIANIVSFIEKQSVCHHHHRCARNISFRDKISKFIGHCVTIIWCRCNEAQVSTGLLCEVETDFIKLCNFNGTGEDLIIKLDAICAVEKFINHPHVMCPEVHGHLSIYPA